MAIDPTTPLTPIVPTVPAGTAPDSVAALQAMARAALANTTNQLGEIVGRPPTATPKTGAPVEQAGQASTQDAGHAADAPAAKGALVAPQAAVAKPAPETRLARAVRTAAAEAVPRQAGLAPLMANVRAVVDRPDMPTEVREAGRALLARTPPTAEIATPQGLRRAVERSGVFLEARMARAAATPPPETAARPSEGQDLKAALLVFRGALSAWLAKASPGTLDINTGPEIPARAPPEGDGETTTPRPATSPPASTAPTPPTAPSATRPGTPLTTASTNEIPMPATPEPSAELDTAPSIAPFRAMSTLAPAQQSAALTPTASAPMTQGAPLNQSPPAIDGQMTSTPAPAAQVQVEQQGRQAVPSPASSAAVPAEPTARATQANPAPSSSPTPLPSLAALERPEASADVAPQIPVASEEPEPLPKPMPSAPQPRPEEDAIAARFGSFVATPKAASQPAPAARSALSALVQLGLMAEEAVREEALPSPGLSTDAKPLVPRGYAAATADATRPKVPPPPYAGGPMAGQKPTPPEVPGDISTIEVVRRLLKGTGGALARQDLMQIASLPEPHHHEAETAEARTQSARLNLDLPFMTPQGVAVAQFEISHDGGGSGGGAVGPAERTYKARFSIDLEPLGPVHALVTLTGARARVSLWAERAETIARLRAGEESLGAALRQAELTPEVAVHSGAPPTPGVSPLGHFVDQAS